MDAMYIVHFDNHVVEFVCYRCVYPFIGTHLDSIISVSILAEPRNASCIKCGRVVTSAGSLP